MDEQVVKSIYRYIAKLMLGPQRTRHQVAIDLLNLMNGFGIKIDLELINAIATCNDSEALKLLGA